MNLDAIDLADDDAPLNVLVCEHSGVQRQILSNVVEGEGFVVSGVSTGEEALEQMQSAPSDLFITGIEVGQMSGIELCWSVKASPATAHVYTMVITASGNPRRVIESLDSGADDFIRKPFDEVELRARLRAASRIVRMQRSLRRLAATDPLTGAANRRSFMATLEDEVGRSQRYGVPLSVAMVDLDHFKSINDTYGHAVGDEVLVSSVRVMRDRLRQQDIVGRLGGEEFCILLPHTEAAGAFAAADKVRQALSAMEFGTEKGPFRVSASFGVASFSAPTTTADSLLQAADEALYAAKDGGRNRVQLAPHYPSSGDYGHLGA